MSYLPFLEIYAQSAPWERREGANYYASQRQRLTAIADQYRIEPARIIAAFAILSPNNSEDMTYEAVYKAIERHHGSDVKIPAYGPNQRKALAILAGEPIEDHLRGQKVTAFYHNTLNEKDERYITVDGHMYNIWRGKRHNLKRSSEVHPKDYKIISEYVRIASRCCQHLSAPQFQATVWITYRRLNGILFNPQRKLPWEVGWSSRPLGCLIEDGASTIRVT